MEKGYLIVEGQKEVLDQLREVLLALKHFPYRLFILDYEVFELPDWWTQKERRGLLKTVEAIRSETTN